ncbi:MAG TPA: hypothetical protein PKZ47_08005, partial [Alistipes sp.]|uniref:hypothetical protein n=1 Tax=Alistipes sp. TaxID=1872444 RepID=UPI002B9903D0
GYPASARQCKDTKNPPPRKFQTKRIIKKSFCVIFITQKVFRVEWKADRDAGNQEIHALFLSPSAACVRACNKRPL